MTHICLAMWSNLILFSELGAISVTIYIVGFWLVEMAISINHKPAIDRNLYENTTPDTHIYLLWITLTSISLSIPICLNLTF